MNKTVLGSSDSSSDQVIKFTEHSFGVDSFNHPAVFYNNDAIAAKIYEIIMMKPGTYPTRPYMGVGLIKNYRYDFFENLSTLESTIQEQLDTYLPELIGAEVSLDKDEENKSLIINISLNDMTYALSLDMETKTLSFITSN